MDRHLSRHGETFWLVFPGSEMKNGRGLEFPLPPELIEPMQRNIEETRPFLLARRSPDLSGSEQGLWISATGTRLVPGAIRERIAHHTKAAFGHVISAHSFRDCAATSVAIADPKHVGIVTTILGHNSIHTAEKYYNQANALDSMRHYQEAIGAFR